jgi:murein DD-endopeptidase MepM/ murein hydrolase activator NlpD
MAPAPPPTVAVTPSATETVTATVAATATTQLPTGVVLITETTGALTVTTSLGNAHSSYDAEITSTTQPTGRGAKAPVVVPHLQVDAVLVSDWSQPVVAHAAALLRAGCRGAAAGGARALAADLQALASVQQQGDRLNKSLQAAYSSVYGAFLTGLEEVAVRNLNRRTRWTGQVTRYRRYRALYHTFEVHEKAYWRWSAAHYAHLVAVSAWHARQATYDRYATALVAYRAALPTYYAQVQAGKRAHVPPPPTEPPWPGKPPDFTQRAPVRLPLPAPVPIPPAPPYQDPSPVPPDAPPQWQMVVQANLQGIGRLGNPWSGGYWVDAREDQLQALNAFEGVQSLVTPIHGQVTTCFGCSNWLMPFHPGLDIAAPLGTPVVAAADGVVRFAGWAVPGHPHDDYGLCVVIQYNQYISSLYAHLNDDIGLLVYPGQTVHAGQVVGYVGLTGATSGPHLHFELRFGGHPFDPMLAPGIRP